MTTRNYGALREADKAVASIETLITAGQPFAFDIEAGYVGEDKVGVSLQQFHPDYRLTGISYTNSTDWARYIPIGHDDSGNVDDPVVVARALWRLLQTGLGVGHNLAYELKGLSRWFRETLWRDPELGEEVRAARGYFPIFADTLLLVWLDASYDPLRTGKDLKSVAEAAFGLKMTNFNDLFPAVESELGPPTKKAQTRFKRFNTRNSYHPDVIAYACEDSVASLMILQKHLAEWKDTFIFKVEHELLPVLVEMEAGPIDEDGAFTGNMMFDWPVVRKKSEEALRFASLMAEEILSTLSERLGRVVNINLGSVPQLSNVLFSEYPEGLGLPVKLRSEKTGAPSTSDDALKVIAKSDPIIKKILEYRQVVKLNGSYLSKFIKEMGYSGTGYVFPNHNQAGALTGRMSVDQVSYQQWPKPYHFELASGLSFDLNFRDLFIAPDGFRIVGFDYANVEMRIAGALSGEKKIIDAFNSGQDLHKATAAATFKVPFDAVTDKQRQSAKTLNFAILFGSGAENIAEMLTSPENPVTVDDAKKMLADYLIGYPSLAAWIKSQQAHGREEKVVYTHFKRKFTIWDHYNREEWKKKKGDRMAVNAPIQGTAADIIKLAMVRCSNALKKAGLSDKVRMTLTVHDALEFLVHESVTTQEVIDLLEPCVNFPIPGFPLEIRADWHEGYQWGAMTEIKLDAEKQITGYKFKYELPWAKQSMSWEGETPRETLDPYYAWEAGYFNTSIHYYLRRFPDFVVPDAPLVEEVAEVLPELPPEPTTFLVTLIDMPDDLQWNNFLTFLRERPGQDLITIQSPEGPAVLDGGYAVSLEDQPMISLLLGGVSMDIVVAEVDADAVFSGMLL